ncbi:MAG: peroxiredoxin [Chthoniobacterales bacterium]
MDNEPPELAPGCVAPDFEASAIGGPYESPVLVQLKAFLGSTVVLYFYPKDDTPGCTTQACGLRDRWEQIQRPDTYFFGISGDSLTSHEKFIQKFALPFPLISDESHEVAQVYGVWVEKSMYGKKFFGTERTTFVIRPDGRIKSVFRKVNAADHADLIDTNLSNLET